METLRVVNDVEPKLEVKLVCWLDEMFNVTVLFGMV